MSKRHKVKATQISDDNTKYKFLAIDGGKTQSAEDSNKLDVTNVFMYRGGDGVEYAIDIADFSQKVLKKMNALDAKEYAHTKLKMEENDWGRASSYAEFLPQFKKSDVSKVKLDIHEMQVHEDAVNDMISTMHNQPAMVIATTAQTPPEFDDIETECCLFFAEHNITCEDDLITFIKKHNSVAGSKQIEKKFEQCAKYCKTCVGKNAKRDIVKKTASFMSMGGDWKSKLGGFAKKAGSALYKGSKILLQYGAKLMAKLASWGMKLIKHVGKYVKAHPAVLLMAATSLKSFKEYVCYTFKNEPWMKHWGLVEELETGYVAGKLGMDQSTLNQMGNNVLDMGEQAMKSMANAFNFKGALTAATVASGGTLGPTAALAATMIPDDLTKRATTMVTQDQFCGFLLKSLQNMTSLYFGVTMGPFAEPLIKWGLNAVSKMYLKKFFEHPDVLKSMDVIRSIARPCQVDKKAEPERSLESMARAKVERQARMKQWKKEEEEAEHSMKALLSSEEEALLSSQTEIRDKNGRRKIVLPTPGPSSSDDTPNPAFSNNKQKQIGLWNENVIMREDMVSQFKKGCPKGRTDDVPLWCDNKKEIMLNLKDVPYAAENYFWNLNPALKTRADGDSLGLGKVWASWETDGLSRAAKLNDLRRMVCYLMKEYNNGNPLTDQQVNDYFINNKDGVLYKAAYDPNLSRMQLEQAKLDEYAKQHGKQDAKLIIDKKLHKKRCSEKKTQKNTQKKPKNADYDFIDDDDFDFIDADDDFDFIDPHDFTDPDAVQKKIDAFREANRGTPRRQRIPLPKETRDEEEHDKSLIFNKETQKYVKRDGRIGKRILREQDGQQSRPCKDSHIRNEASGRCVKRDGAIGKRLLKPANSVGGLLPSDPAEMNKYISDVLKSAAARHEGVGRQNGRPIPKGLKKRLGKPIPSALMSQ